MRYHALADWLRWQETLHPSEIELGLTRVAAVFHRLHPGPVPFKVITVGGTNGKGSSCAMLEAIYRAAGYRVGVYTSPHLLRYNERIRINGEAVGDQQLVAAFDRIDQARGDTSLTYFEFATLAAFDLFWREPLDLVVLEVGMGGRLDAVNILDADLSLVTNVDLDHTQWLGDNREDIGYEKAGVYRQGRPAIFNDPAPPARLRQHAAAIGADLLVYGEDYRVEVKAGEWLWRGPQAVRPGLPYPNLRGRFQIHNAAGVVMAVESLQSVLPVSGGGLRQGLIGAHIAGRLQSLHKQCEQLLDVAHNPHGAAVLAQYLGEHPVPGTTYAVVAMLGDKDVAGSLGQLCPEVGVWLVAGLGGPRGTTAASLAAVLRTACPQARVESYATVTAAYGEAEARARAQDRIVVFGSFYTVAEVLAQNV